MPTGYASSEPRTARQPRQRAGHPVSAAQLAERHRIQVRDAGLWRIGAATRWLLAGAIGSTGALALLAAGTFHGHTLASPQAAQTTTQSAGASAPQSTNSIAAPAQPPVSSAATPVVVSGGS
jgi:hypothetical protein